MSLYWKSEGLCESPSLGRKAKELSTPLVIVDTSGKASTTLAVRADTTLAEPADTRVMKKSALVVGSRKETVTMARRILTSFLKQ